MKKNTALEENYISAVIVVHNDSRSLAGKLQAVYDTLSNYFKYFEIIVVDNFSPDNTVDVLRQLQFPVSIVTLSRWHNSQSALTAGIELAVGDYILEIPSIGGLSDYGEIIEMYRICQQGNDFVFLIPEKTKTGSRLFYRLLNDCYKGQISERFVSSLMILSSRRGQNKTADVSPRIVNRSVAYLLTGLKCANLTVKSAVTASTRRSLRENFDLMASTLIFHTDYISSLAFRAALFFFAVCVLAIVYSLVMFFAISTAPGWASTFVLIAFGFSAVLALLAVICKYLSSLIKLQNPKNYTFSSIEKRQTK
jgi:hypothetical protein